MPASGNLPQSLALARTGEAESKGRWVNSAENMVIVRTFIDTWPNLDVDRIVEFFAQNGVYHNMPMEPVRGQENLRTFIAAFLESWTETSWEILSIASTGNVVFVERIDRIIAHGKAVALPCCGVFELENGKIKVWRDYFDMDTYRRSIAG